MGGVASPVSAPGRRARPRWGRIALVVVVVLALLTGVGALSAFSVGQDGRCHDLKRTDAFADIVGRPPKVVDGSLNILLLGTDSRDPDAPVDQAGNWRTDTIMVMHIPANHEKGYLISIPRDLWVHVPASKDGEHGDPDGEDQRRLRLGWRAADGADGGGVHRSADGSPGADRLRWLRQGHRFARWCGDGGRADGHVDLLRRTVRSRPV